jgi:ADP-ribose pyrophosphatase YjhB (NUDIX family)
VREVLDRGRWLLPGGWAEVNESPSSPVEREVREESGVETSGVGLLAPDELPESSTGRILASRIRRLFEHHGRPDLPTDFD